MSYEHGKYLNLKQIFENIETFEYKNWPDTVRTVPGGGSLRIAMDITNKLYRTSIWRRLFKKEKQISQF